MAKKLNWCQYEVVDGPHGRYIQENGEWGGRGGGSARVLAERGIEFPHQGPDAILWLVRDGKVKALATRGRGLIRVAAIEAPFDSLNGIHIEKTTSFLKAGDGFVITSLQVRFEAGPIDMEEDRPRPTIYNEE